MLPVHFGHWRTVYGWFRELARRFLFQTIHDIEVMLDRERQGDHHRAAHQPGEGEGQQAIVEGLGHQADGAGRPQQHHTGSRHR